MIIGYCSTLFTFPGYVLWLPQGYYRINDKECLKAFALLPMATPGSRLTSRFGPHLSKDRDVPLLQFSISSYIAYPYS